MQASDVIDDVRKTLNDNSEIRWTTDELISYLNAAMLQVALVRPDASAKTEAIQLVAGTKQSIPSGGLRLLDVIRNMGTDGATPGYPVTPVDRTNLDLSNRLWHKTAGKTAIKNFSFDEKTPKTFYCTPPVSSTTAVYAEISYSDSPTPVTAVGDTLPLDDVYRMPLHDWVLRMAFGKEIASSRSQALSARYENAFYQSLGIKSRADIAVTPNAKPEVKIQ